MVSPPESLVGLHQGSGGPNPKQQANGWIDTTIFRKKTCARIQNSIKRIWNVSSVFMGFLKWSLQR